MKLHLCLFNLAKEKPLLTHCQKKIVYGIIWSDESKFEIRLGDNGKRVLRTYAEAYHSDCLVKKVKYLVGIHECKGCRKTIFNRWHCEHRKIYFKWQLVPSIPNLYADNGHTIETFKTLFSKHGVLVLEWPSRSPDLSPIESVVQSEEVV